MTSLDLSAFVPVGCVLPTATFYDTLLFKTLTPLVIIVLLWTRPLIAYLTGKPVATVTNITRTAARWSLFLMEFIVSGVSTTIASTFSCQTFDDGSYLTAQMTLACDDSAERRSFLIVACLMTLIYPIGKSIARCSVITRSCHTALPNSRHRGSSHDFRYHVHEPSGDLQAH